MRFTRNRTRRSPESPPSETIALEGLCRLLRSQLRRLGLGHPATRDPGWVVPPYHQASHQPLNIGSFYFGEYRNFLLWPDAGR